MVSGSAKSRTQVSPDRRGKGCAGSGIPQEENCAGTRGTTDTRSRALGLGVPSLAGSTGTARPASEQHGAAREAAGAHSQKTSRSGPPAPNTGGLLCPRTTTTGVRLSLALRPQSQSETSLTCSWTPALGPVLARSSRKPLRSAHGPLGPVVPELPSLQAERPHQTTVPGMPREG